MASFFPLRSSFVTNSVKKTHCYFLRGQQSATGAAVNLIQQQQPSETRLPWKTTNTRTRATIITTTTRNMTVMARDPKRPRLMQQDETMDELVSDSVKKPTENQKTIKLGGYDFFSSLGSPKFIVAPMVEQSELAYRMLCRRYGAELCYTPMIHSRLYLEHPEYRVRNFTTCPTDRPLIAQFCGNDPDLVLQAAKMIEDQVDAIDLNLGCPQAIARKGHYGSFLLDEKELVRSIIEKLHQNLSIPVTCKIRLLPDFDQTMDFCNMLVEAGCQLLVVHGRTRDMKTNQTKACDWEAIAKIKKALPIPVIANGGIEHMEDLLDCLEQTGVDGVMTSEGILENPAMFTNNTDPVTKTTVSLIQIAKEYMELVKEYPTPMKVIRAHLFKFLHRYLRYHTDMRTRVATIRSEEEFCLLLDELDARIKDNPIDLTVNDSWYRRYRKNVDDSTNFAEETSPTSAKTTEGDEK